jgi:diguanylate cyclase (GGDEF)-like protein/PAS domain S-box-containing protein
MSKTATGADNGVGFLTSVVVPTSLTAGAFVVASHFGLVGDLPLWLLLALMAGAGALGQATAGLVRPDTSPFELHAALAAQVLPVSAIIYAIGWGPTLMIGYVFVVARVLDAGGSRVWRATLGWMTLGVALGQIAIVLGVVPTYVPDRYVHGLAVLGVLGMAFVVWLLGTKTEQNERAFAELDATLSLLSATLDSTADGILVVDTEGSISQFNSQFSQMWRLPDKLLEGRDDGAAVEFVLDQLVRPELFIAKVEELYAQPGAQSDDTLEFKDGRVFERHSRPQQVDGEIVGRVWSFRDVTDRHRLVNELAHQAFHDSLTGLANRALLRDRLEHALARSRRLAATVAVLFCDLDGFKMVNDTLGHDAGDVLLVEVARRLEHNLRDGDTAARLGGDEFAIVLDETTTEDTTALAQRLLDALRDPFVVNNREVFVPASIGIADNGADVLNADELLSRADIAMYAAKSRGRNRIELFEPTMQTELAARHELHGDLRHALQNDELIVHYQPLLDLETQTIESFEALVRWNHPTRGLVGPDEFIPIAEETGLIVDLGRFVLRAACRATMEWRALPGAENLNIGVNVSSQQLYDDMFVDDIRAALDDSGLPATALILELTESTLLSDTSLVQERLEALKHLGIRIALDDFGTGYSSLAYLRAFPIDFLKIDQSFVNELSRESDDQGLIMVRSIISIGHNLNLGVIAEGIEQTNQLDELRKAGCNTGQGYLFARPVPPEQIPDLLRSMAVPAA